MVLIIRAIKEKQEVVKIDISNVTSVKIDMPNHLTPEYVVLVWRDKRKWDKVFESIGGDYAVKAMSEIMKYLQAMKALEE